MFNSMNGPLFSPVAEAVDGSAALASGGLHGSFGAETTYTPSARVSYGQLQAHYSPLNGDYPVLTLNQTEFQSFKLLVQFMDTNAEYHPMILGSEDQRIAFYDHPHVEGKVRQWVNGHGVVPLFVFPTNEESPTGRRFIFGLRPHNRIAGAVRSEEGIGQARQDYQSLRDIGKLTHELDRVVQDEFHHVFGLDAPVKREEVSFVLLPNGEFERASDLLKSKENRRTELSIFDGRWDGRLLARKIIMEAAARRASDIQLNPVGCDLKTEKWLYAVSCEVDGKLVELDIALDGDAFKKVVGALQRMSSSTDNKAIDNPLVGFDGQVALKPGNPGIIFTHDDDKLRADMNLPTDAPLAWPMSLRGAEFRIARVPTPKGPKLTVRIHPASKLGALQGIGFTKGQNALLEKMIRSPKGLIIMTGPTGSGKTTTLYTMLNQRNDGSSHIVTLEQPIEQDLPGACVTQIQMTQGTYEFKDAMRQVLRLAPKIILIGEMRDADSARAAVDAANTGHLVFSTVHVNDSPSAILRLCSLGVEQSHISDSLRCIMAQRLLAKINMDNVSYETTGTEVVPSADPNFFDTVDIAPRLSELLRYDFKVQAYRQELSDEEQFAKGTDPNWEHPTEVVPAQILRACPKAKEAVESPDYSPTKGRAPIIEILVVDDQIRKLINSRAQPEELKIAAMYREHFPFVTMEMQGLAMVLLNQVTLEEFEHRLGDEWTLREPDRRAAIKMVNHFLSNMHREYLKGEDRLTVDELLDASVRKGLDED